MSLAGIADTLHTCVWVAASLSGGGRAAGGWCATPSAPLGAACDGGSSAGARGGAGGGRSSRAAAAQSRTTKFSTNSNQPGRIFGGCCGGGRWRGRCAAGGARCGRKLRIQRTYGAAGAGRLRGGRGGAAQSKLRGAAHLLLASSAAGATEGGGVSMACWASAGAPCDSGPVAHKGAGAAGARSEEAPADMVCGANWKMVAATVCGLISRQLRCSHPLPLLKELLHLRGAGGGLARHGHCWHGRRKRDPRRLVVSHGAEDLPLVLASGQFQSTPPLTLRWRTVLLLDGMYTRRVSRRE